MIWVFLVAAVLVVLLIVRKRGIASQRRFGNRLFYARVHGITHKNQDGTSRQKIIKSCSEGEELFLIPEPDNRFDAGAVKICRRDGEQLGYWSGDGRMAGDLAAGCTCRVTVYEICPFSKNRRKHSVRLRVEVLTMSRKTEARRNKAK
jgi:hypothetical protein